MPEEKLANKVSRDGGQDLASLSGLVAVIDSESLQQSANLCSASGL